MKKITFKNMLFLAGFALFMPFAVVAQEVEMTPFDTLASSVNKLQSDLAQLKKIKVTGYVQAQYQLADTTGISSFAGGNFPANVDNRFSVRRGRVKIMYDNTLTSSVVQFDVTEKGVAIKDAYIKITEPWTKSLSLTSGVFDRPFGFEISYSSSMRESPERARMTQTLFPGERDLGAKITFQPPKTSKWNFFKAEAGMFNGVSGSFVDFDSKKDFIGNIGINKTTKSEKINYAVRASYYNGGWRQATSKVYAIAADSLGMNAYLLDYDTANYGAITKREYIGADAQVNIDWVAGLTSIRGEYIQGKQPTVSGSSTSPTAAITTDAYIRNFRGMYFYLLQNIAATKFQAVVKYDVYDPNTDIAGDEIKNLKKDNSLKNGKTDIKYATIGLGLVYRYSNNVKLTAYYDIVKNETSSNLKGYSQDLSDNVFTLRLQYKF
ncbi:MAG: porin [Bacteroidales bacterium]|nr:porin [Bacteroidales bacterium]